MTSSDYAGLRSKLVKEMGNDFVREATAAGIDRATARAALKDPSLSRAFSGRGKRAWDSYQERLGHLATAATRTTS
jgi:hypothetical protein